MSSKKDGELSCSNVSAGGLVWVRRPNGSWWPGRVVGLDELEAKCVVPPRSGTPIKLLGREDGSMDWYNLAKSARIKAFRCGEFDECIEKVMISGVHSKKRSTSTGKYIRREDAIRHALEIEKPHVLAGNQNGSGNNDSLSLRKMIYDFPKRMKMYKLDKQPNQITRKVDVLEEDSAREVAQPLISSQQKKKLIYTDSKLKEKKRRKTPNDSEENGGIKRMRDLQDIGLGIASNRKSNVHVNNWCSTELLPASHHVVSLSESNISDFCSSSSIKRRKYSVSSLKRKQSHVTQDHENTKIRNCQRSLSKKSKVTKVILPSYGYFGGSFQGQQPSLYELTTNKLKESPSASKASDVPVIISPHYSASSNETPLNPCENIHKMDSTKFDSEVKDFELASMLEVIDNECSNALIDIPLVVRDYLREDLSITIEDLPSKDLECDAAENQHGMSSQGNLVSHYTEGLGESSFTGNAYQVNNIRKKTQKKTLQQYLNGKKNLNGLRFNKNANSKGCINRADQSSNSLKDKVQESSVGLHCTLESQSLTFDPCGQSAKDDSISEAEGIAQDQISGPPLSGNVSYSQSDVVANNGSTHSRDQDRFSKICFQVSTLPRQLFPDNKLSLTDHAKYKVLRKLKYTGLDSHLFDVEVTVKSHYYGSYVPLISLTSKLNIKEIVGHPIPIEVVKDGFTDTFLTKKLACSAENKSNAFVNSQPGRKHNHTNVTSLKMKYSESKKSRLSSRKIRRLSSISVDGKRGVERKMVAKKLAGSTIACVPIRLVFSRITEALTCSSLLTSIS
ncbi:uncharacterized protein At1g51745-like isoform X1 [Zingiber officinale]|nr:uncharacterized protein At1g51745-like isoform X1 [Zingiber officinale]